MQARPSAKKPWLTQQHKNSFQIQNLSEVLDPHALPTGLAHCAHTSACRLHFVSGRWAGNASLAWYPGGPREGEGTEDSAAALHQASDDEWSLNFS